MATNFPLTRFGTQPQGVIPNVATPVQPQNGSFYAPQVQALQRQMDELDANPGGMYTPEQIEERRAQNQRDYEFGMLGMLSGDKNLAPLGGEMYKQAMVGRTPKTTEKGAYDPITGQWTYDPAWKRENLQGRLEKLQNLQSAEQQQNLQREDTQAFRLATLLSQQDQARALHAVAGSNKQSQQDARVWTVEDRMADDATRDLKGHQAVLGGYNNIKAIASRTDPMAGTALVFAYMKMLDPTSVVREGEAASVRNAAGVPDRIINWYNNTLTGDQLGPKQRAEILATAEGLAQVAQKGYDSTVRQYNDKARRRGLNPLNVTGVDDTPPKAPPGRDVDVGNRLGNKPPAPAPPTAFPLTRGATGGY